MASLSKEVVDIIRKANSQNYASQAVWFLNACFHNLSDSQKEEIFQLTLDFAKQDHVKGAEGCELNMTQSFNMLQAKNQTMTALELKAQLRKVDIDANGEMALIEYAIFAFNQDATKTAMAPQGSASEEEQRKLDAAEENMKVISRQFEELSTAQAAAKAAEEEVRAIQKEAEAIAAEIAAEEKKKADEIARLEALSTDQSVGIVKRNMAVQQLAAAKGEDPLPLRKAKLTQDATVRRLTKATDEAAKRTAEATAKAEECAAALKQAEADLEELKRTCQGIPHGSIWMMERQLKEKKRFLPQRMQ